MKSALHILQTYWKHDNFRDSQEEIINSIIQDKSVICLLPTGAGKSLCFQIPALMKKGVCIVISPLIALMQDQVNSLQNKGIKAIALTSKYNREDTIRAFDNLCFGNYKFLYLSPEKLQSKFIQEKIAQLDINLIAVDEAHCISEWGHDFRPAYLKIPVLKQIHPQTNIIALTASATARVMEDIKSNLELEDALIFKKSFFRNNLNITIIKTEDILSKLKLLLSKINEPTIVYTNTRKKCIDISNYLNRNGYKSSFYHGGMLNDEKIKSFEQWNHEHTPIIVATNAFGMGIDKPNVRAVIHMNIPNSLENYSQEFGRAGRDGKKSYTFLLYNDSSILETENNLNKGIVTPAFCKEIYAKIHNHYLLTKGEFSEKIYDFNLQDFCSENSLSIVKTYHALNTFETENILEIEQGLNKRSSIKIIVPNSNLIEFEKRKPNLYIILKVLLRNYGGVFEQFININESFIAKKIGVNLSQVVRSLIQLDLDRIIVYNKNNSNMQLKFLVPREDTFVINRIARNLEKKNKIKIEKSKAIVNYVINNQICRNIQLLNYFGEANVKKCLQCDICRNESKKPIKINYGDIAHNIIALFQNQQEIGINEILIKLEEDKINIIKTLELLIEKNTLQLTSQNKLELKEK